MKRISLHGENKSADVDAAAQGVIVLNEQMVEFSNEDRVNVDETGLYWRCLPSKTLGNAKEDSQGFKKLKDRITVVVLSTASGYFDIWIIGKSKKPRAFRACPPPLASHWYSSKNGLDDFINHDSNDEGHRKQTSSKF